MEELKHVQYYNINQPKSGYRSEYNKVLECQKKGAFSLEFWSLS